MLLARRGSTIGVDFALGRRANEEEARRGAEYVRECVKQEAAQQCLATLETIDVTDLLPQVRSPTSVLHRRGISSMSVDVARGLVSGMPDAQLVLLEGTSLSAWEGDDVEGPARAIEEFLGEGKEAAAGAEPAEAGAFRAILFTDVEGSTALTDRLGDARAREVLREPFAVIGPN